MLRRVLKVKTSPPVYPLSGAGSGKGGSGGYDYLLVVGPGRSGSEFLYRVLRSHPCLVFPEIKERSYYRSPRALKQAWRRLDGERQQMLCDIANGAYRDSRLSRSIEALRAEGFRVLLVALLRNHRERAVSMLQFRKSRGESTALFGATRLEEATVRDRLTAERLAEIFRADVDVLTISFSSLTRDTKAVLEALASLCGIPQFDDVRPAAVNQSVGARFLWLSAGGHWCAIALRHLGFRRLLQGVKENQLVNRVFFVPLSQDGKRPPLSAESLRKLDASALECQAMVEKSSERLSEGLYLRAANPGRAGHD